MKRQHLAIILIIVAVIAASSVTLVLLSNSPVDPESLQYTYQIVNVYPHDENAFTQGLIFEDGFLYESTGLYGQSTLRRVELETGNITQLHALPDQFFGEGITIFDDKIIHLTWQSEKGFVYDKNSFDLLQEFTYPTEGGESRMTAVG